MKLDFDGLVLQSTVIRDISLLGGVEKQSGWSPANVGFISNTILCGLLWHRSCKTVYAGNI